MRIESSREVTDDVERVDFKATRQPAHHRVDAQIGITTGAHVTRHLTQRASPADAEPADSIILQILRNEVRRRATHDHGDLLVILRRRNDDCGFQLEVADELLLQCDAGRELRVERDADETVPPRIDQDAIDPQPRGVETARNFRLGQALHEIEPRSTDFGLVVLDHRVGFVDGPLD